ncbi:MAG: hypothetical protein KDD19_26215 [Phaeodactylibacter sp.]|nr:hypothetical protein [Phaeodactylibacter sp.]MCB9049680.1 hypothetical protein [Lewinellaceae bacterium]
MKKTLIGLASGLAIILILLSITLYSRYGGGQEYDYVPAEPFLGKEQVYEFFSFEEPIGNVAATPDTANTRVFFTIHPESRPKHNKLCEIVEGKAVPYPTESQEQYITPLGLFADRQNRLWVIDHGNHGLSGARLLAFNLATNEQVMEYTFSGDVAEKGSFFNDLSVTPDGKFVFIADVSFFGKQPSLVVFDVEQQRARSLLDGHESVSGQGYVPVTPSKKMRFLGGLVDLMPGIDGLDVSPDGAYVYYAAMSHSHMYRVPVGLCTDFSKTPEEVAAGVEMVSRKPLSDGIRVGPDGWVYITDIEHQSIDWVDPAVGGKPRNLLQDSRIRWADGLSFGGDGYCYLADSAIPDQMLRTKGHMRERAPYYIFRWRY